MLRMYKIILGCLSMMCAMSENMPQAENAQSIMVQDKTDVIDINRLLNQQTHKEEELQIIAAHMEFFLRDANDIKALLDCMQKNLQSSVVKGLLQELGQKVARHFETLPDDVKKGLVVIANSNYMQYLELMLLKTNAEICETGSAIWNKTQIIMDASQSIDAKTVQDKITVVDTTDVTIVNTQPLATV